MKNLKSQKELRNLFQLRLTSISDTYDSLHRKKAKPCQNTPSALPVPQR